MHKVCVWEELDNYDQNLPLIHCICLILPSHSKSSLDRNVDVTITEARACQFDIQLSPEYIIVW